MPRLQESSETFAGVTAPLTRGLRAWSTAGSLLLAAVAIAAAQTGGSDYPSRPVRIIVNVAPGGGVDTATRIVTQRLAERMGQPFVVENRASASGNVGAEAVFHAAPDGYTLLASSGSPLAINGWIYKKLNYDPAGFEPVAIMSRIPNVLVVRKDFPAATVKDFIDYVKAHPGKVSYASQGSGTASHLTAELFMALTKTSLVHVPYKGTSPALNDLVAGHVDSSFIVLSSALELARAGKLRILAVATDKRIDALPAVPTLVESGYPELISSTWNAISAPPRTAAEIVARLNTAINEALQDAQVQGRFRELQLLSAGGSLGETKAVIEKERRQWGEVVEAAGIKPE
jgi:tripartite-type tricarboxylate transporter receptor subunit TctC